MGKYGDMVNSLDTGQIVKINPGTPVRLRILADPYVSQPQFKDGSVSLKFSWPVWDYRQSRVRILNLGKSVFDQIANSTENWPEGETMPSPFDVVITRKGAGPTDTTYTVAAVPASGTMPAKYEVPDMVDFTKGMGRSFDQVHAGELPPVYSIETGEITAGGSAKAIEGGEQTSRERDAIPTADDVDNINIDDIPF